MHDIAISIKNLSKKYRLYDSPQHRLKEALHPFRKKYHRDFWALKDVSFEIKKGETIGIIGKNGSGKSTLLQIICGVLQASEGEVSVNGRISALLELGAGFNPEFTGRQNVYLNGAINGFTKEQMDERFDAIAEFAEIGDFIDQPVKIYSSGMYVRLAFAAAINVDPDILIVDEALAVGDIKFQRKCFANIEQFRKRGKTILFVTHAMDSVNLYCDTAVLIDKGQILEIGIPKNVTRIFQKMMLGEDVTKVLEKKNDQAHQEAQNREKEDLIRIRSVAHEKMKTQKVGKKAEIIDQGILDKAGKKVTLLETGERYIVFSRVLVYEPVKEIHFGYPIHTAKGLLLFAVNSDNQKIDVGPVNRGDIVEARTEITMWLAPGNYFASFKTGVIDELYDEVVDMLFVVSGNLQINPAALVNLEARMTVNNIQEHAR